MCAYIELAQSKKRVKNFDIRSITGYMKKVLITIFLVLPNSKMVVTHALLDRFWKRRARNSPPPLTFLRPRGSITPPMPFYGYFIFFLFLFFIPRRPKMYSHVLQPLQALLGCYGRVPSPAFAF